MNDVTNTKLDDDVAELRGRLAALEERVRLDAVARAFLRGDHAVREGDCFLICGDHPTRLQNINHAGRWTYHDGHFLTESSRIPDHQRLYTIAEVAEILAMASAAASVCEARASERDGSAYAMGPVDLSDGELASIEDGIDGPSLAAASKLEVRRMVAEIRRRRAPMSDSKFEEIRKRNREAVDLPSAALSSMPSVALSSILDVGDLLHEVARLRLELANARTLPPLSWDEP
jgi:hypothetical protein